MKKTHTITIAPARVERGHIRDEETEEVVCEGEQCEWCEKETTYET